MTTCYLWASFRGIWSLSKSSKSDISKAKSARIIMIWKFFYAKINTTLLLYLYQIFLFLLSHIHFFLYFFFSFIENLFKKHPIWSEREWKKEEGNTDSICFRLALMTFDDRPLRLLAWFLFSVGAHSFSHFYFLFLLLRIAIAIDLIHWEWALFARSPTRFTNNSFIDWHFIGKFSDKSSHS